MSETIQYLAEPTHVREVSLLGTADPSIWIRRLAGEGLRPAQRDGKAQIMVIGAEMTFMGLRFSEVSFSVLVSMQEDEAREAAFTRSCRPLTRCRSRLLGNPELCGTWSTRGSPPSSGW